MYAAQFFPYQECNNVVRSVYDIAVYCNYNVYCNCNSIGIRKIMQYINCSSTLLRHIELLPNPRPRTLRSVAHGNMNTFRGFTATTISSPDTAEGRHPLQQSDIPSCPSELIQNSNHAIVCPFASSFATSSCPDFTVASDRRPQLA